MSSIVQDFVVCHHTHEIIEYHDKTGELGNEELKVKLCPVLLFEVPAVNTLCNRSCVMDLVFAGILMMQTWMWWQCLSQVQVENSNPITTAAQ